MIKCEEKKNLVGWIWGVFELRLDVKKLLTEEIKNAPLLCWKIGKTLPGLEFKWMFCFSRLWSVAEDISVQRNHRVKTRESNDGSDYGDSAESHRDHSCFFFLSFFLSFLHILCLYAKLCGG